MSLLWRSAMAIDNSIIDHDHQVLLSIINDFCEKIPNAGGKAELERTLAKLHHYTQCHFEREEQLQAAVHFPSEQGHRELHRKLIERLDAITEKVTALDTNAVEILLENAENHDLVLIGSKSVRDFLAAYDAIRTLLRGWLVDHIVKCDLHMKPYVEAMRPHAAVMPSLWSAAPALLAPNTETAQAAKSAFLAAKAWMPAGFRKEQVEAVFDLSPKAAQENPVIAKMRRDAQRLGMVIEFDPECHLLKDRVLQDALSICRANGTTSVRTADRELTQTAMHGFKESAALFERIDRPTGPCRYVVRRTGAKFARIFGEIGGRKLEEAVSPSLLPRWLLLLDGVLEYGAPLRVVGLAHAFGRDDLVVEGLLAPFHDSERNTTQVLAVASYEVGLSWSPA